jgi:uncharacterized protein (DUF2237 family)
MSADARSRALNVLGTALVPCGYDPLTGWYRDGCCHTDAQDAGSHVICAKVTVGFLNMQLERGNDLITPRPEFRFPAARGAGVHTRQGTGVRAAGVAAPARRFAHPPGIECAPSRGGMDEWFKSHAWKACVG